MFTIFGQKSIIQVSCGESVPQKQDLRTPDQIADDFLAWAGLEGERAATVRADIIAREAWLAEHEGEDG